MPRGLRVKQHSEGIQESPRVMPISITLDLPCFLTELSLKSFMDTDENCLFKQKKNHSGKLCLSCVLVQQNVYLFIIFIKPILVFPCCGAKDFRRDRVNIVSKGGFVCFNIPCRADFSKVIFQVCGKLI